MNNKSLTFGSVTGLLTRKTKMKGGLQALPESSLKGYFSDAKCYMTHAWEEEEGNHHYLKGGVYFHPLLTHCLVYEYAIYGMYCTST